MPTSAVLLLLLLDFLHLSDTHPVDLVAWTWNSTTTECVEYCEKIVDGPMSANGDMGLAIGGE